MCGVCWEGTVAITLSKNASQPCNNSLDRQGFTQRVGFFFLVKANVKTHSCQVKGKSSSWNASEACNSKSVTAAYASFNLESPLQTKSWFGEGRLFAMCLKQVSSLSAWKIYCMLSFVFQECTLMSLLIKQLLCDLYAAVLIHCLPLLPGGERLWLTSPFSEMFTSSQVFYHRKQPIITNITYLHWRDAWLLIGFSEMFTKSWTGFLNCGR